MIQVSPERVDDADSVDAPEVRIVFGDDAGDLVVHHQCHQLHVEVPLTGDPVVLTQRQRRAQGFQSDGQDVEPVQSRKGFDLCPRIALTLIGLFAAERSLETTGRRHETVVGSRILAEEALNGQLDDLAARTPHRPTVAIHPGHQVAINRSTNMRLYNMNMLGF